jgi:hypothetical protein
VKYPELLIPHDHLVLICEQTYFASQYMENKTIRSIMEWNDMFVACAWVMWKGKRIDSAGLYEMKSIPRIKFVPPSDKEGLGYKGHVMCGKICLEFGQEYVARPRLRTKIVKP